MFGYRTPALNSRAAALAPARRALVEQHRAAGWTAGFLESTRVMYNTKELYRDRLLRFLYFVMDQQIPFQTVEQIDNAGVLYLDELFGGGDHQSVGRTTITAFLDYFPQFGRRGPFGLPRTWRSLDSWDKRDAGFSRLPMPWEVCAGIAVYMFQQGWEEAGIATLLSYDLYSRPSETLRLTTEDVTPPIENTQFRSCAVCLNPRMRDISSKTGEFDETLQLTLGARKAVGDILHFYVQKLRQSGRTKLFGIRHADWSAAMKKASEALRLPQVQTPYQCRHGGASHDRSLGETLLHIQRRGRWAVYKSVKRYEKVGALQTTMSRLSKQILSFCMFCAANLWTLYHQPRLAVAFP
jgi:hypothetical protein